MTQRRIELLAPARNTDTGIAAINCGADAVYIGPEKFSARSAAGNPVGDIEKLAAFARKYNARVFAAMNTILFDHELEEAEKLIWKLFDAGIDALIIQDMGILEMNLPPLAIHASTQAENSRPERIEFLASAGINRIVLARELSIEEIRAVRERVSCELELFIHGALCVCYSGNCYLSAAYGGRSANRGECAQPCRKEWALETAPGDVIAEGHLLSTKDLNHTDNIPQLIDAGIDSFKIEGRLKDIHYVKNITAHYRRVIDRALEGKRYIRKSSSGTAFPGFNPDPEKTFNRGYTEYFLHGRRAPVSDFTTPKFRGKLTAHVVNIHEKYFTVDADEPLHNGDGLTFTDPDGRLRGIRVNRVESRKVFPLEMSRVYPGAILFRNHDTEFIRSLGSPGTGRKIDVDMKLTAAKNLLTLELTDEDGTKAAAGIPFNPETSKSGAPAEEAIERHLKKTGATIFRTVNIALHGVKNIFIPPSSLNELRRNALALLEQKRIENFRPLQCYVKRNDCAYPADEIDFSYNVSNRLARSFYERHGVKEIKPAFELIQPEGEIRLMKTRLCIRYETGRCPVYQGAPADREKLFLTDGKRRYALSFNCSECVMMVWGISGD